MVTTTAVRLADLEFDIAFICGRQFPAQFNFRTVDNQAVSFGNYVVTCEVYLDGELYATSSIDDSGVDLACEPAVEVTSSISPLVVIFGQQAAFALDQAPGSLRTGEIDLLFTSEFSSKLLRPFRKRGVMRYFINGVPKDGSENVLYLVTGLIQIVDL